MSNTHQLDQDHISNELNELSPSVFDSDDNNAPDDTTPNKKKSMLLIMVGGIFFAITLVIFFIWKIVAPHLHHQQRSETIQLGLDSAFTQAAQQPETQVQSDWQAGVLEDEIQPAANPQMQEEVQKELTQSQFKDDLIQAANARIEELEKSLALLKETVDKLVASEVLRQSVDKNQAVAQSQIQKAKTKSAIARKRITTEKTSASADKANVENNPKPELQLKAVLDGRAWFQTKGGESITVAPGEMVRGMGTVKVIDAERGQVIFSNGIVMH